MASSSSSKSGAAATSAGLALFLLLNLVLFTSATACGYCPTPNPPSPGKPKPPPQSPPSTPPPTPPSGGGKCPIDTLKLGVCANVLSGLINVTLGKPPKEPCCPLLSGLVDLEAAVCLCTAIKANVLGLHLNIPVDLSLLLNYCGKSVPTGFQCP